MLGLFSILHDCMGGGWTDWSMRSWHQNEGLLCLFIHFWPVSDDLNTNNSHSHTPPNLINESVTLRCHAADMSYITTDRSQRPAACTRWPRVAIFLVGFPELESPFKQNATILPQAGKLLSVKRKKPLWWRKCPSATSDPQTIPLHCRQYGMHSSNSQDTTTVLYVSLFRSAFKE